MCIDDDDNREAVLTQESDQVSKDSTPEYGHSLLGGPPAKSSFHQVGKPFFHSTFTLFPKP